MKNFIKFYIIKLTQLFGFLFFNISNKKKEIVFDEIQKILIIRLDEIGDVVMTSPLLRELRQCYPKAEITFIVKPQVYNLVQLCPYVNNVLVYEWIKNKFKIFSQIFQAFVFCRNYLNKECYDIAIVPRWDVDTYGASFIAYFSGAKFRWGYSEHVNELKEIANKGYDGFFSQIIDVTLLKHEVERNMFFLECLKHKVRNSQLESWINVEDTDWAEKFLKENMLNEAMCIIALFPSAGSKRREWDINKFIELINLINSKKRVKVVVFGDIKNTKAIQDKLVQELRECIVECVGKTTIRQTLALMKKMSFYLGSDTGPMHLAVACGLKGVVISCHPENGARDYVNSPERFGPWQSPLVVIRPKHTLTGCADGCQKNYAHCINQITVTEVYEVVEEFIKNG